MIGRWVRDNLVLMLGLAVLAYTFVPIAVVVLMSFNAPASRNVYQFDGFTLDNWINMGFITEDEKYRGLKTIWSEATNAVEKAK